MNYNKIYTSIVLRAQCERRERLLLKAHGEYFEDHHIIPRSLNGKDELSNIALLTGREHFICHWLLVKIYPINTIAHEKMLYALWRMSSKNNAQYGRYVNSHVYEYYRKEFASKVRKNISDAQFGCNNSQYGTSWYTNCYNGECRKSREQLSYPWYKGRNLFRGECRILAARRNVACYKSYATKRSYLNGRIRKDSSGNHYASKPKHVLIKESSCRAKCWWDAFHNGNYKNLEEFGKSVGKSKTTIYLAFETYIPMFSKLRIHRRRRFESNAEYVEKYE